MKKKTRTLNFKHVWHELGLTDAEQLRLEADLLAGVERYRRDNEFARYYTDAELLSRPFVMGIGAVEVARRAGAPARRSSRLRSGARRTATR
jgi:hypothetical protein